MSTGSGTAYTRADAGTAGPGLTFLELVIEVSRYLGTLGDGDYPNAREFLRAVDIVESGYRQFLFPPVLQGDKTVHQWSFLSPETTLAITTDDYDYDLPADFNGLVGRFAYDSGVRSLQIRPCSEGEIRELRGATAASGDPYLSAIRPKAFVRETGQLFEVIFYPTPATDRTLRYRYRVAPLKLGTPRTTGESGSIRSAKQTGTTATCSISDTTVTDSAAHFIRFGVDVGDTLTVSAGGATAADYEVDTITSETALELTVAPVADGTATYTLGDESYTVFTKTGADFDGEGVLAGDRVLLHDVSGPTDGLYVVRANGVADTTLTFKGSADATGTADYKVFAENAYGLGGVPHSETLLASCLDIAELRDDDTLGTHSAKFIQRLAASVAQDRANGPTELGYNADSSAGSEGRTGSSRIGDFYRDDVLME